MGIGWGAFLTVLLMLMVLGGCLNLLIGWAIMAMGLSFFGTFFLVLTMLGGCFTDTSSRVYTVDQMFNEQSVRFGHILSIRPVDIAENTNYTGTAAGALVGSTLGGSLSSSGSTGQVIGSVLGAVAGGLAGNTLQKKVTMQKGVEITVKLRSGSIISVIQKNDQHLAIHQHVRIVSQPNGKTRVMPLPH